MLDKFLDFIDDHIEIIVVSVIVIILSIVFSMTCYLISIDDGIVCSHYNTNILIEKIINISETMY